MTGETLGVSQEFKQSFHSLYPKALLKDGHERRGLISLVDSTVYPGNFDQFKWIVYNLAEIGAHASIGPAEQLVGIHNWITESAPNTTLLTQKYEVMLACLITPPYFLEPMDKLGFGTGLKDILNANLQIKRKTPLSRAIAIGCAVEFLRSDRSAQVNLGEPMATLLIVNNQVDKEFLPIWEAILKGKNLDTEGFDKEDPAVQKLLKQDANVGFYGIIASPALNHDFHSFPLDLLL